MHPTLYRHGVVNDLAAALSQPSLMAPSVKVPCFDDGFYATNFSEAQAWLLSVDAAPQDLMAHIEGTPRHNRLGLYYESLLSFWLKSHHSWKLLAHELPVYQERQTLGAYDFLIETPEAVLHIEVAIKFYMGIRGTSDWYDWVGPGLKDSLGLKMEKMLDKQIRLSQAPAGAAALKEAGIPLPTQRKLWLKGMFFRPYDAPDNVAPHYGASVEGIWYPLSVMGQVVERYPEGLWVPRLKPDWLSKLVMLQAPKNGLPPSELIDRVQEQWRENGHRPMMWSLLLPKEKMWVEVQRVFFAPDDWRQRAGQ